MGKRSTRGAQTHLKPYIKPIQDKNPMVVRSIPASRNQKLKVPKTSKSGKPAEKPKPNIRSVRHWVYVLRIFTQLLF